ncbi:MAG: ribbon-helix-helix protein, CopG family [Nanoarchaeota archaeon]|nr:ribbon-helix-helix protein, CopG family [Nanoarchaeota archaeon]
METISLKLDDDFLDDIEKIMRKHRYTTKTEFVREALRDKIKDLEKEEIIKKLAKLKGSLKGKAKMSYEEARKLAGLEVAKKFGIKLD